MILGRILRITVTTIIALVFIALLLAWWFLFTTEGNRESALLLTPLEPRLQIDIQEGNLLEGIKSDSITWTDDNLTIKASNIESEWNPLCTLGVKFCAEKVLVDTLRITSRSEKPSNEPNQSEITLPSIQLPLAVNIDRLEVKHLILDVSTTSDPIELQNIKLQAYSKGDNIVIKRLSARFKNYIASASGSLKLSDNYPVDLKLATIAEDLFDHQDLSIAADLSGNLSALKVDATTYGMIDSRILGRINTLAPALPMFVEVNWKESGWPLDSHANVSSTNGSIKLQGDLNGYDASLKSTISGKQIPTSELTIDGLLDPKTQFRANEITINTLEGIIKGNAAIHWKDDTAFSSSLYFTDLNPAVRFPDFPGNLAGNLEARGIVKPSGHWELDIEPLVVQGDLLGTPLHAHAVVSHDIDATWKVSNVYLVNNKNKISLKGEVSETLMLRGNLDMNAIESLVPGISGGINGNYYIAGSTHKPDINLNLRSTDLSWKDVTISDLAIETGIRQLAESNSQIKASASKITQGNNVITDFAAMGKGSLQSHDIQLALKGPSSLSVTATTSGSLSEKENWQGYLLNSVITIPKHTWTLAAPAKMNWDTENSILHVARHCWRDRSARFCLNKNMNAGVNGAADLSLKSYNLSNLNGFLPEQTTADGIASINALIKWGDTITNGFSVDANLKSSGGTLTSVSDDDRLAFTYQSLQIQAESFESGIHTRMKMDSQDFGTTSASFSLLTHEKPLIFENGLIKLDGFDISFLEAFLPDMQTVAGEFFADLSFSGPVEAPEFSGEVTLRNPKLLSEKLPLQITGGKVQLAVDNRDARISGRIDSGNGLINLGGNLTWKDKSAWHLNLKAAGDALVFRQKPLVQSVIAPDLTISVRPGDVEISGKLKIIAAAINIREIPEGATSPSSDVIILEEKMAAEEKASTWKINSAIDVQLGDAVRLSAYGLRAQLTGDMKLVQKHDRPLELYGEIIIPEGMYKSYGQDLTIRDGQILLIGPVDQTTLNIEAYREVEDVRAGLLITGDIESPVLTLQSEPPLEQERILAYIVLGRDIAAGENNDSNILATAALSMGIKNGRGLATDIAETFGVREFNIEASGRGEDTQVLLSGRLSSRLLVRYGVGVFTPVNTLYLRYDLSKKLYLETAQGLERAVDLFYAMEF